LDSICSTNEFLRPSRTPVNASPKADGRREKKE
jgi:hypothetical protein